VEAILAFISAAEIRHASAMANVYLDENEERLPPIPKPPSPELHYRQRSQLGL
jgi:hypothetical protein